MKKLFLWTLVLTLLCTWAVAGAEGTPKVLTPTSVSDRADQVKLDQAEQMRRELIAKGVVAEGGQRAIIPIGAQGQVSEVKKIADIDRVVSDRTRISFPGNEGGGVITVETCPPNSMFGQDPHGPNDSWSAGTSDVAFPEQYLRFESFSGLSGDICDIHWWGLSLHFDNGWFLCEEDPYAFEIIFYNDDGLGMPDVANPVYTYSPVVPTRTLTGDSYVGFPLYRYDLDLTGDCLAMTAGWVSIQGISIDPSYDCAFLWMSALTGDGFSWFRNDGNYESYLFDLSLCLTPEYVQVFGACCDDESGVCNDGVEQGECPPPLRFAANTPCDQIDPACGAQPDCHDFSVTAPVIDATGSTCGAGDDCDLRASEEVIYEVTIPYDGTWVFSLCGSSFDTYLYIGTTCCGSDVGENDDACGTQSEIIATVTAGAYYVDIEAWSTSACGDYVLNVYEWVPPQGACCYAEGCVSPITEQECYDSYEGSWVEGADCDDPYFSCPGGCLVQLANMANGIFSDIDCDICGSGIQILAENFVVDGTEGLVTALTFWGGYYATNDVLDPDLFTIIFRENAAGTPGAEIARMDDVPADVKFATGRVLFGVDEYQYTVDVSGLALSLGAGTYFVEIYNNTAGLTSADDWFWEVGDLDPVNGVPGQAWTTTLPEEPWNYDSATDMSLIIQFETPCEGACCDETTFECTDFANVVECYDAGNTFSRNILCADLDPPCTPSYCDICYADCEPADDHITNVTFNTINNTTGEEGCPCSYGDYTALSTEVGRNETHNLSVSFYSGGWTEHVRVWFDWNQNYVFECEESYYLGSGADITVNLDITIPDDALLGPTRMRVIEDYGSDPGCDASCIDTFYGEAEDYTVVITAGPPPSAACCYEAGLACADITEEECTGLSGLWNPNARCADPDFPTPDCQQDECSWNNGPPLDDYGSPASQYADDFPFGAGAADDFVLSGEGECELTNVQFWTTHWNGAEGQGPNIYTGVNVTVYRTNPDPIGPGGHLGDDGVRVEYFEGGVVATQLVAMADVAFSQLSPVCSTDDWELSVPISLMVPRGERLWLEIQPVMPYLTGGQAAIRLSHNSNGLQAQQIFGLAGLPEWTDIAGNSDACPPDTPPASSRTDLAFILTGSASAACEYVVSDVDCDGQGLTQADVIAMIFQYRGTVPICYVCPCPPHSDTFAANADPDGNCIPLQNADVVAEIFIYRGSLPVGPGCVDCPGTGRLAPGGITPSLKSKVKATQQGSSD